MFRKVIESCGNLIKICNDNNSTKYYNKNDLPSIIFYHENNTLLFEPIFRCYTFYKNNNIYHRDNDLPSYISYNKYVFIWDTINHNNKYENMPCVIDLNFNNNINDTKVRIFKYSKYYKYYKYRGYTYYETVNDILKQHDINKFINGISLTQLKVDLNA